MFNITDRLKEIRFLYGLTQKDMANFLGTTQRTYQNYEYGTSKFQASDLLKILTSLDISADFFFLRVDNDKAHKNLSPESTEKKIEDIAHSLDEITIYMKVQEQKHQKEKEELIKKNNEALQDLQDKMAKIIQENYNLRQFLVQKLRK